MKPTKTISCKKLQTSGLVRAATVAAFTRPNVRQLVVIKETTLEVWEIDREKPVMIATTGLWVLVCNCEVLQSPTLNAVLGPTSIDRIVIQGVTLVAMAIYQNMIQLLLVAWVPTSRHKEKDLEGSISFRPVVNEYLLCLKNDSSFINLAFQLRRTPIILDLSFIEELDYKGHPLLVVLSGYDGLVYDLVNIQSYTLDLANAQIHHGPWKISKELLFIESSGYRASLSISLSGIPTCCEVLRESCLVVGDSNGALCVLDLKRWKKHDVQPIHTYHPFPPAEILKLVQFLRGGENGDLDGFVLFLSGPTSNSELFALLPDLTGRDSKTPSLASCDSESLSWTSFSDESLRWYTKEYSVEDSSLDEPTSVHSMILVDDPCKIAEKQILIICGMSPTATFRRGSLGVTFNMDKVYDEKGMTEILALCDEDKNLELIEGLEKDQTTLAVGIIEGDWLFQVTTKSLRVMRASTPRVLVAEWQPPAFKRSTQRSKVGDQKHQNIMHASVCPDGAVLSNGRTIFSMKMGKNGPLCAPCASSRRPFEVSALGIFECWMFGDNSMNTRKQPYVKYLTSPRSAFENADLYFLVVAAQWSTNSVHLLTWPELEEITYVETGCCPVRCVCVTAIGKKQYLIVGTAEGSILHFQIEYDIPKMAQKMVPGNTSRHGLGFDTSDAQCSLKEFCLKLVNGRVLKVGGSVLSIIPGPFCGPELDSSKKLNRILEKHESVIIQTDHNSIIMISGEEGDLQPMSMSGSFARPVVTSFRIHTERNPNSLALLSKDKQLVFGHVDLSVKLRWRKIHLVGNPQQLAYHRGSGCAVITLNVSSLYASK
ncbi:hypothetical protein R1flu_003686 [Riccia fluitans]|uniref:RSE1/DDB1/CPSF1 second beta-propeller domain-containing protein n=1 Tax=Riccia fluitans TaxID=41844 RepID=A0ABD1Y9N8_9MARC